MAESYLAIADADKIHEYVFGPKELKLIRGGSAVQAKLNNRVLLDELTRLGCGNLRGYDVVDSPTVEEGADWEVVFAGGGRVMCHFATHQSAVEYCARIKSRFLQRTRTATITTCIAGWDGDFGTTLDIAQKMLEVEKNGSHRRVFTSHMPYSKTCESCGSLSAGAYEDLHCPACHVRFQNGRASPYFQIVNQRLNGRLLEPEDFGTLAKISVPDGYLALIYVDGDSVGQYLADRGGVSKQRYRELSRIVRQSVEGGVLSACERIGRICKAGSVAPFEVLLIGGDDAIAVVAAQHAVDFLAGFADEWHVDGATFSAAIVWAHHHYPIAQFIEEAERLVRSAKRRKDNTVDYRVVSEAMAGRDPERRNDRSTMKPYTIEDFVALRDAINRWKSNGVPSNKARALYRMAFETEHQARLDYLFLLSRLEEPHKQELRRVFGFDLWDTATGHTKAADLIELWDFVGG